VRYIGILGGTFDPVHHGHLRAAIECHEQLAMDEVRLVPVNDPGHRHPTIANPTQRLVMLRMATENIEALNIDDHEINRGDVTYTIDTLVQFRKEHPGDSLSFIMGSDAFETIDSWRHWNELLDYAHFIIVKRPVVSHGFKNKAASDLYEKHGSDDKGIIRRETSGRIIQLQIPLLDISATRIRSIISNGQDPGALLPYEVIDYIDQHNLYR